MLWRDEGTRDPTTAWLTLTLGNHPLSYTYTITGGYPIVLLLEKTWFFCENVVGAAWEGLCHT